MAPLSKQGPKTVVLFPSGLTQLVVYESIMTTVRRAVRNQWEGKFLDHVPTLWSYHTSKMKIRFETRLTIDTTLKIKCIMSYILYSMNYSTWNYANVWKLISVFWHTYSSCSTTWAIISKYNIWSFKILTCKVIVSAYQSLKRNIVNTTKVQRL